MGVFSTQDGLEMCLTGLVRHRLVLAVGVVCRMFWYDKFVKRKTKRLKVVKIELIEVYFHVERQFPTKTRRFTIFRTTEIKHLTPRVLKNGVNGFSDSFYI